ncbi:MAG: poly-gamma-glutamate system protein [Treponema sp.]|nr:poly-gamma-glutamate system protein [Treponema sp.]
MRLVKKNAAISRKTIALCCAAVLLAVLSANLWRVLPPDPDCEAAASLYAEIAREIDIVGIDYSSITTTLGNYAAKKSTENPVIAALMVRLLKDAGVTSDSVIAINASGSFPGFLLAALSACTVLGLETRVVASIGSSTYGANVPGNTIADMLTSESVRALGFTLLAVTPGGSGDRGLELDSEELARAAQMLEYNGVPFIQPENLAAAIALRSRLLDPATSSLLVNIGGNHAAMGDDVELALRSGILQPEPNTVFSESGLVQHFLAEEKPVIQILNLNKLYATYGLTFDSNGKLISGSDKIYRQKALPPFVAVLPIVGLGVLLVLFGVNRYSRKNQRRG